MIKRALVDAGPLIALFDKDDHFHQKALHFLQKSSFLLNTTWPVLTEVSYMLSYHPSVQQRFLTWVSRGALNFLPIAQNEIDRILQLSIKHQDVPMDLADASLVVVGEREKIKSILTIDSDFHIYRNIRNEYLTNIFI